MKSNKNNGYQAPKIKEAKPALVVQSEILVTIPQPVLDFAKGVSQLRRDTDLTLLSFDWSEPMLEMDGGKLFFLIWDDDAQEYSAVREGRQREEEVAKLKSMMELKFT